MAQTMVNFRMDEELKKEMEQVCKDMGITMTTAFTMFAIKVTREKRIPFEVSAVTDQESKQRQRLMAYYKAVNEKRQHSVLSLDELMDSLEFSLQEDKK